MMFPTSFRPFAKRALFLLNESVSRPRSAKNAFPFSTKSMKVAVLGAASKTGTCLSFFLKQSPIIDELAIYDTESTYCTALELNHIDTKCQVSRYSASASCLEETLRYAKIVMIVADEVYDDRSEEEILKSNAETLSDLLPSVIRSCPRAMLAVAMNPVNSLVPLAAEMYKRAGVRAHTRLFGVTTLNCVRANTFAAEALRVPPECVLVPVIGGGCPETCIPVFSQTKPHANLSQEERNRLTRAVRTAGEQRSRRSIEKGGWSFAAGFAAARFCVSLCKALRHQPGVVECAYVRSCVIPGLTYFAGPLEFGPEGVQKYLGVPALNRDECGLLETAIPVLRNAIGRGETLALGHRNPSTEFCPVHADPCYRTTNPPPAFPRP